MISFKFLQKHPAEETSTRDGKCLKEEVEMEAAMSAYVAHSPQEEQAAVRSGT